MEWYLYILEFKTLSYIIITSNTRVQLIDSLHSQIFWLWLAYSGIFSLSSSADVLFSHVHRECNEVTHHIASISNEKIDWITLDYEHVSTSFLCGILKSLDSQVLQKSSPMGLFKRLSINKFIKKIINNFICKMDLVW